MFGPSFEMSSHKEELSANPSAKFETSIGDFQIELFVDKSPIAAWNFINLAEGRQETEKSGPYYDGIIFHRVIDGFMVQAGCPQGQGTGGPGYEFKNEDSDLTHSEEGILAMANRGRDTNGSQFYITLNSTPHLDGGYTIFGKITEGMDTIKKIGSTRTDFSDRPVEDIVINKVSIIRQ